VQWVAETKKLCDVAAIAVPRALIRAFEARSRRTHATRRQRAKCRHPLMVFFLRMPWQQIEASVAHLFSRLGRAGTAQPDLDLFGEQVIRAAPASNARRAAACCAGKLWGLIGI